MSCDCTSGILKVPLKEGYYYNRYTIANDGTLGTQTGRNAGGIINLSQYGNWRVANNSDWGALFTDLGGSSVAGGKMKAIPFWNTPNTGATNSSFLSFRPNGSIPYTGGGVITQGGDYSRVWSGGVGTPTTRTYLLEYNSASASSSNSANPRNLQGLRLCRELVECETDYDDFSFIEGAYIGNDGSAYSGVKINNLIWLTYNLAETKYNDGSDIYAPVDNADWLSQPTYIGIVSKGNNFQDTGVDWEVDVLVNDCTDDPCQCLELVWESASGSFPTENIDLEYLGTINGRYYYEFNTPTYPNTLRLYWRIDPAVPTGFPSTPYWVIADATNLNQILGTLQLDSLCPEADKSTWNGYGSLLIGTTSQACPCQVKQERIKKKYESIKLPSTFTEQDRGDVSCCCQYNVLGNAGNESWKSDISSAWLKVASVSDLVEFKLFKKDSSGTVINEILLDKVIFPNDAQAYYSTVNWKDILSTYGVGCYHFKIEYSIAGVVGLLDWGIYNLKQYTIENALNTARVRVKYNGYQEIEQINFKGSDVEDSFRFFGYIGNRQPNTEIDNIIYGNREMKRVIRENLNTYEIITDPSKECITRPLIERFLLSENELYISDYNAFNHSYRYEDLPVIVEESPELEYYEFSRKAKLSCKVSDKYKNKRTYF